MATGRGLRNSPAIVPILSFLFGTFFGAVACFFKPWKSIRQFRALAADDSQQENLRCDVPENAPEDCPGLESDMAGKSSACAGCPNQDLCASGAVNTEPDPSVMEIAKKMQSIKKKILVLSGKGGVGKSTVSSQLSWILQERGFDVGILDIDVCGPSIPKMTGSCGQDVHNSADGWSPVYVDENLAVMSIGFLLPAEDDAVIWRGPKKNGLIKQFLTDVNWGALDMLIIDTPPGTSDEHLSIVTYLKEASIDGVIVVTTPQEVSLQDVRKEITFCKKVEIPIIGLVENMTNSIFDNKDAVMQTCTKMDVPYGGSIPLDSDLLKACEAGISVTKQNPKADAIPYVNNVVDKVLKSLNLPLEKTKQIPAGSSGSYDAQKSSTLLRNSMDTAVAN